MCTFCKISALADVEPGLVRASVQNLLYHRVVGLASIFQYSNVYTVTPALAALRTDSQLQRDLLATAARQEGCLSDFRYLLQCRWQGCLTLGISKALISTEIYVKA